jgi:hypothetical protein
MRYRKKPVVVDAIRVPDIGKSTCNEFFEALRVLGANASPDRIMLPMDDHIVIHTLEGEMRANPGDWIIKGVMGEFYPCKSDVFEATYEPQP